EARVPRTDDMNAAADHRDISGEPDTVHVVHAQGEGAGASTAFGASMLPDQGVLLVGFTQFVVGRAKVEASAYIINRFSSKLCTETYRVTLEATPKPLRVEESVSRFIPTTCTLLSTGSADALLGS